MNVIYTTALLTSMTSTNLSMSVRGPEPLPLVLLASLFLLTSWLMRRVGAKN
jgi:hypothetical protein